MVARERCCECPGEQSVTSVQTSVIEPEVLDDLVVAPCRSRLSRRRPDRSRRRDRLRRPRLGRRPADRLDGRAGRRQLPARAPRRRGALRLRGRPALVEAVPASRRGSASGRRGAAPTASRSRRSRSRTPPLAFLGVRSCELHAIAIQDRVFLGGSYVDRDYAARREDAFVVAVNCCEPAGTCFCVSMGTGPKVEAGLRPRADRDPRRRRTASSSRSGASAAPRSLRELPRRDAEPRRPRGRGRRGREAPPSGWAAASTSTDIRDLLARNLEHPRWDEVAERCLTCGNCTLVCPTCFCTSVEDVTDLTGDQAERYEVVGLVLLGRLLVHPRRQHPALGPLALPPVADAQVRHLVRPVRQLGLRRLRALHHLVPGRDRRHRGGGRDPRRRKEATMETIEQLLPTCRSSTG